MESINYETFFPIQIIQSIPNPDMYHKAHKRVRYKT